MQEVINKQISELIRKITCGTIKIKKKNLKKKKKVTELKKIIKLN